jgi:hypothetical protein
MKMLYLVRVFRAVSSIQELHNMQPHINIMRVTLLVVLLPGIWLMPVAPLVLSKM